MRPLSIAPAARCSTGMQQAGAMAAQHLKQLDRCARSATADQSVAVRRQIDAVWRGVLQGCASVAEAGWRAAYIAGLMLGGSVAPEDLDRARRASVNCNAPFPFVAASLFTLLNAWSQQEAAQAMQDAFARLHVAPAAGGRGPGPHPPAPGA